MGIGIPVRIERDGRYESVDVCEMTEEELHGWTSEMNAAEGQKWVRGLVKWIREHVNVGNSAVGKSDDRTVSSS